LATAATGDSTVYQYYHTDWNTIRETLSSVAAAGYDAIQVPPAQSSRLYEYERESDAETYDVPLGYQPIDFTSFDSVFGTEAEYAAMVEEAHEQGLEVIADAVINHLAAGGDYFERQVSIDDIPRFSEADFHEQCPIDYSDPESVENCWLVGLRDLDHEKPYVRQQLRNYVAKYADLGVDGIRFDAAKHVPEWFFREYATRWTDDLGLYAVGEVLEGSVSYCQQYVDTGMSVTDYPLYYTMREYVFNSGGDMRALEDAGVVDQIPFRALTFVSNHDSVAPEYELLAYAYILTYEGYPRVYNHRIDPDNDEISTLLSIRRELLEGAATTRYVDAELYAYERGDALIVLNRGDRQRAQVVETDLDAGDPLSDCTGSAPDAAVREDGTVEVTVPPVGYAVYATRCVDDGGDGGRRGGEDGDDGDTDDGDEETITLQIEAPVHEGESVYFTGGIDALTDWDTGIEGTLSDGVWSVTIAAPGDFEWKTRRGPAGDTGRIWENGANHTSGTPNPGHNGWADGFDESSYRPVTTASSSTGPSDRHQN
jgi:alpha-amylase